MSLFQCEWCGCRENTATSNAGGRFGQDSYDWSGKEDRKGLKLCSVCLPTHYQDGEETGFGKWHNMFPRMFLPKGKFFTNDIGNLEHKETGSEKNSEYALTSEEPPVRGEP